MCVFDAVCTIWNNNRKEFYLNTIWELLSGNEDIRFLRNALKDKLRESVEKLQRLRIFIAGTENAPQEVGDNIDKILPEVVDICSGNTGGADSTSAFIQTRRAEIFQDGQWAGRFRLF